MFLDGVGIGSPQPDENPFLTARLPTLSGLLGGRIPTLSAPHTYGPTARAFPLDATLGVDGRPQSGTGQTALLTGENTARAFGRHFGPWTPTSLRPLLAERNVLVRAQQTGKRVAFANSYPRGYLEHVPTRRQAAPPLAADAAGLLTRHEEHLGQGRAVASEIVNTGWRTGLGFRDLPVITPGQAGVNLARIASEFDLTFYAHYRTDQAGHTGERRKVHTALERVDGFMAGIMSTLGDDTLMLVASDHGNIEAWGGAHTRNPVLGLIAGRREVPRMDGLTSIVDVPGAILELLGTER